MIKLDGIDLSALERQSLRRPSTGFYKGSSALRAVKTPDPRSPRAELVKLQQGDPENLRALAADRVMFPMRRFERLFAGWASAVNSPSESTFYRDRSMAHLPRADRNRPRRRRVDVLPSWSGTTMVKSFGPRTTNASYPLQHPLTGRRLQLISTTISATFFTVEEFGAVQLRLLPTPAKQDHFPATLPDRPFEKWFQGEGLSDPRDAPRLWWGTILGSGSRSPSRPVGREPSKAASPVR